MNVPLVESVTTWEPEMAFDPDQAPEAVHDVALVEDQMRVEDWPVIMNEGEAEIDTVGRMTGAVIVRLVWARTV